jgi:hypothetical protein
MGCGMGDVTMIIAVIGVFRSFSHGNVATPGCAAFIDGQIVPFVFSISDRTGNVSLKKIWIPISLTNRDFRRIVDAVDGNVEGYRMRSSDKPAVGEMRKRMTRRCVSAATGACR